MEDSSLFEPNSNCCDVAKAHRAAVLIDGAAYFAALDAALECAQRFITIIGWDFDASIQLRPQDGATAPALGDRLRSLVEENPDLEVRILIWSLAPLHTPSAAMPLLAGGNWAEHERIHLHLDTFHPIYASHHQKLVIIDNAVAFVGGMDLTVKRWDTPDHAPDEPLRRNEDGSPYEPVHDVQMALAGPVVQRLCVVAQERWYNALTEQLPDQSVPDPWPAPLAADFQNVSVAVSRTLPRFGRHKGVSEAARLTDSLLQAAKKTIYIEAQYFTGRRMGRTLERLLAQPEGPEVIVVCTYVANGILERFIMGANRERLLRRLKASDQYNRLHVYYPVIDNDAQHRLLIHSKVMIIDDRFLRIGSANLNNRSVGLDTECDVTVISQTQHDSATIHRLRNKLLAEHLGVAQEELHHRELQDADLCTAIDGLRREGKSLRPVAVHSGPQRAFPGTFLLDPERPLPFLKALHRLLSSVRGLRRRENVSSDKPNVSRPRKRGTRK